MLKGDIPLTLVETWAEAQDFIDWLDAYRGPCLAVDTETEGFRWWDQRVRLVQLGSPDAGWSFRWDRWSGLVAEALERYRGRLVFHNAKFDMLFMRQHGIDVDPSRVDDTRIMAHLIDPASLTGLKPLCDRYLGEGSSSGQEVLRQYMRAHRWDWRTVPIELPAYWAYGALDCVLTASLWHELIPRLEGLTDLYELELAVQSAVLGMEWRGTRVDTTYAAEKQAELTAWATEVRAWAASEGVENLTSNSQLASWLMARGWEPTARTATGKPKMDKEVLEGLATQWDMAQACIDVRHAEKLAKGYFGNLVDLADTDGYVHPSINTLGAITGRMSVTQPALQTLPREALVRNAFIPREGNSLILIDYDQMELRIMADFSDCATLRDLILTPGVDLHKETAALLFGVKPDEVTKDQRGIAKTATYAKLYMSGAKTFAATTGLPIHEAKGIMQAFDRAYPEIANFANDICNMGHGDEWVTIEAPSGRRHKAKAYEAYKLVNYVVQGHGADVLKRAMVDLDNSGLGDYVVMPVHDELVFDAPSSIAEDVLADAMTLMTDDSTSVPLTVEGKIVSRWGDPYA